MNATGGLRARAVGRAVVSLLLTGVVAGGVSAQAPGGVPPLYSQQDLLFLHHMIVHHEQALELAALVPSRTTRDELIRFARHVAGAQQAEIDQMRSLLALAEERGIAVAAHELHDGAPMPGLLPEARMAEVAAASGAAFERAWLEGMIFHHEGALTMARAQQQRQFESSRRPYGIDVLVDEILVVQRAEITKMKAWLETWAPQRRSPR